ncbi:MAG: toll/interleukin-1 receptor domain-containing protein [Clostridiales bacterium]|nr:toll/interleukin-1 receptor domain-containing protein [Clostridiales bacterium]
MDQVRCTNCGSTAIIPDGTGEFCKCEACGSTFSVKKAEAFSRVVLDHTQDVRAWREYLAKQLKLQQDSNKARDYSGVKLFAQKILSVLPDDFCALYYSALADRYSSSDAAFVDFLKNASLSGVTPDERKEVAGSVVATVEPKYLDDVKAFIKRAYPDTYEKFNPILDRNIKLHIQKLRYAKVTDRDVFICHRTAEPDQDIADAICSRLEERGLRCWIAPRNILAGSQNYERDILKGVENCRVFLLVSSFKSIYSEDCETELKAAVLANKALYSFRIDDTPYDGAFERALRDVQWLDGSDDPYAHLEQLVIDIRGILARDEREKAELEEKRLAMRERERIDAENRRKKEQERLDRLERIVTGGAGATGAPSAVSLRSKLRRAEIELQSQNFDRTQDICDEVLDIDPECAQAWWLLMLCDYRVTSDEQLIASGSDFMSHRYYKNAMRFSDDEPSVERRLTQAVTDYQTRTVKSVVEKLDQAEHCYNDEDWAGVSTWLDECAEVFSDENSVIFGKFPDVASRFYWLSLWAKYEQTPLVCVEDITRETEYKKAVKYASPAQSREYDKARETVSRNAQMFLRERSKKSENDSKLSDYLVDNKNILPIDVYNQYSSMLYFRKMLKALNMTETSIKLSTIDISTNEYFMLAYACATDEQKDEYDVLLKRLEKNRSAKNTVKNKIDEVAAAHDKVKQEKVEHKSSKKNTIATAFAFLSYLFMVFALIAYIAIEEDECGAMLIISAVLRIVSDAIRLDKKLPINKSGAMLAGINLGISLVVLVIVGCVRVLGDMMVNQFSAIIAVTFASIIISSLSIKKYKRQS